MAPAPSEPSLADVWRRTAQQATDAQLAACAALPPLPILAIIAVAVLRPRWTLEWWPAVAVPLLVSAFGIWGIGQRELRPTDRSRPTHRWAWRLVEATAVAVAVLSAAVIVLWILTRVVGTWIS